MLRPTFGSSRRITRSSRSAESPVECYDDDCAAEYMERREETRKGKLIEEDPAYDVILGDADTESSEDNEEFEDSGGEDKNPLTYKQAIKIFRKMRVWGTRYIHRETMMKLGIAEDVDYMLDKCGLTYFVSNSQPAYKKETCQFLASVEMNFYDEDVEELAEEGGYGYITFLAKGNSEKLEKHDFTVKQFEELFELPAGKPCGYDFENEELQALWQIIAGPADYVPSRSKSNKIRNPAIHYFHRVIANTCFPRMLTGNVRQAELEMIDEGLKELLNRDSSKHGRVFRGDVPEDKFSSVLLDQLLSYRSWASKLKDKTSGVICVGGIVTAILKACGARLKSQPIPPTYIDIPYLKRTGFLERTPRSGLNLYILTNPETDDEEKLQLPNPELTTLRIGQNIDFRPPNDVLWTVEIRENIQDQQRIADEIIEQEPDCYYFDEQIDPKWTTGVKSAHKKNSLLQRWNKFQDGMIDTLVKSKREMSGQIKELQRALRFGSRSRQKTPSPQPQQPSLRRTRSVSQAPRRRSTSIPARTSSYMPRAPVYHDTEDLPQFSVNFDPNSTPRIEYMVELISGSHHYRTEHGYGPQTTPFGELQFGEGEAESARAPSHFVASDHTAPIDNDPPPFTASGLAPLDFDPYDPTYQVPPPYQGNADPKPWNWYF